MFSKNSGLIRQFIMIGLLFCQCFNLSGQFLDDFSDSDLNSNPVWEGNVQDFVVNEDEMLQLNAPEGSTFSHLFTQLTLPDSIQWDFEFELDFSPSTNNRLRIYLAIDQQNLEQASGYYIEVGENGPNDAINFYYLNQGASELLASGEMAALGSEPAYAKLNVRRFPTGDWVISTSYEEASPLAEELAFQHLAYEFEGNQIFQLECNYTSSRSDKFSFDNIGIKKYELDKTGPVILGVTLFDPRTIDIQANESLDLNSVEQLSNYNIDDFSGTISGAALNSGETGIRLTLSENLESGRSHTIRIAGLKDANGNEGLESAFQVFVIDQAAIGDIVVNEILFNPETGGSDFIEILNVSSKSIFLGNLEIINADKQEMKPIISEETIGPGEYLCLSEDVMYIKERYETPDTAQFLEMDIPSLNNDAGNVSIRNIISGDIIDSYDYNESQHFQELDDINGVSLERVSPFDDKWFSASAAVGFATPGYQNSVYLVPGLGGDEVLSFESKTFSPNQDGSEDQLVIKYKLPGNGYQVDINIYDEYGRLVRTLVNNELFSEQGFVLWDGVQENGETGNIGVYFIVMEGFNVVGDVISVKKPAILADFLK